MKSPITVLIVFAFLLAVIMEMCGSRAYSQTVEATPAPRHSVQIVTTTPVSVVVAGNVGALPRDYVIVVPANAARGKEDSNINPWKYLNDKTGMISVAPTKGITDAVVGFVISKPGQYEARLYRRTATGSVFLGADQFVAELAPLTTNLQCTETRKPDGATDVISLTIQGNKCQITASEGSPVKTQEALIDSGP